MLTGQHYWNLAVWVWLPISVVLVGLLVWAGRVALVKARAKDALRDKYNTGSELRWTAYGCWTAAVALVVLSVVGWIPFGHEYHALNEVRGTVAEVNKRIIPAGDSPAERYVIRFAESPELFGCDDTRCALAAPGKRIRLMCTREFEFRAASGWACRYGQKD